MPDSKVALVKAQSVGFLYEDINQESWRDDGYDEDLKDPLIDDVVEYVRSKEDFKKYNSVDYDLVDAVASMIMEAERKIIEVDERIGGFSIVESSQWGEVTRDCYAALIKKNLDYNIQLNDMRVLLAAVSIRAACVAYAEASADKIAVQRGYISVEKAQKSAGVYVSSSARLYTRLTNNSGDFLLHA